MELLTPKEVYDCIRHGAADGGWQGFATCIQRALIKKNRQLQNIEPKIIDCPACGSEMWDGKSYIMKENDDC